MYTVEWYVGFNCADVPPKTPRWTNLFCPELLHGSSSELAKQFSRWCWSTDGRTGVVSTLGFLNLLRKECLIVNKRVIFYCFAECSVCSSGEPFCLNCGWRVWHVGLLWCVVGCRTNTQQELILPPPAARGLFRIIGIGNISGGEIYCPVQAMALNCAYSWGQFGREQSQWLCLT